jgi:hypothetical protein
MGSSNNTLEKEEARQFSNMKGAMMDILEALEHEYDLDFVKSLRVRVKRSQNKEELRLIMDGMLVIAGFAAPRV